MKVYKATDKDMRCRGLQYEPGKPIEADGELKLCENGLHACESPLELFDYYSPADGSRYFEAEAEGVSPERQSNSSKVVAKKMTLGAEIGIPGLVKAHIEYIKKTTNSSEDKSSSGDWAQIGSSGDRAQIGSSGDGAQIDCSGKDSVVMCAGIGGIVKGRIGTWITLAEYTGWKCVLCKSAMIDGETLKADTWYALKNGEFVEVEEYC